MTAEVVVLPTFCMPSPILIYDSRNTVRCWPPGQTIFLREERLSMANHSILPVNGGSEGGGRGITSMGGWACRCNRLQFTWYTVGETRIQRSFLRIQTGVVVVVGIFTDDMQPRRLLRRALLATWLVGVLSSRVVGVGGHWTRSTRCAGVSEIVTLFVRTGWYHTTTTVFLDILGAAVGMMVFLLQVSIVYIIPYLRWHTQHPTIKARVLVSSTTTHSLFYHKSYQVHYDIIIVVIIFCPFIDIDIPFLIPSDFAKIRENHADL